MPEEKKREEICERCNGVPPTEPEGEKCDGKCCASHPCVCSNHFCTAKYNGAKPLPPPPSVEGWEEEYEKLWEESVRLAIYPSASHEHIKFIRSLLSAQSQTHKEQVARLRERIEKDCWGFIDLPQVLAAFNVALGEITEGK